MWFLLAACNQLVEVSPSLQACADVNFEAPPASVVEAEMLVEASALVWRTNVYLEESGLSFAPTFAIHRGVLSIYEAWEGAESADPYCYQPQVQVDGIQGDLEVRWFLGPGETVPFETLIIE